jgi:hypothetical protein
LTNGVASVPFKGPLLSQVAYRDPGLRVSTDVDPLVVQEHAERAMTYSLDWATGEAPS